MYAHHLPAAFSHKFLRKRSTAVTKKKNNTRRVFSPLLTPPPHPPRPSTNYTKPPESRTLRQSPSIPPPLAAAPTGLTIYSPGGQWDGTEKKKHRCPHSWVTGTRHGLISCFYTIGTTVGVHLIKPHPPPPPCVCKGGSAVRRPTHTHTQLPNL